MSEYTNDPTGDLYRLMDEAGLTETNLKNSKKGFSAIVNSIRTSLAMKGRSYITQRDHHQFDAGVKKGEGKADVPTPDRST